MRFTVLGPAEVEARPTPTVIDGDDLVWRTSLTPGRAWQCELDVALPIGPNQPALPRRDFAGEGVAQAEDPVKVWQEQVPHVGGDSLLLNQVTQTALSDMIGLRILWRQSNIVRRPLGTA